MVAEYALGYQIVCPTLLRLPALFPRQPPERHEPANVFETIPGLLKRWSIDWIGPMPATDLKI
jgi:hypothetical protein